MPEKTERSGPGKRKPEARVRITPELARKLTQLRRHYGPKRVYSGARVAATTWALGEQALPVTKDAARKLAEYAASFEQPHPTEVAS